MAWGDTLWVWPSSTRWTAWGMGFGDGLARVDHPIRTAAAGENQGGRADRGEQVRGYGVAGTHYGGLVDQGVRHGLSLLP
jgi:hypothetical protein